jgi:hypothetical protein
MLIAGSLNFPLLVGVDASLSIADSYETTEAYNHTATKLYFLSQLDIDFPSLRSATGVSIKGNFFEVGVPRNPSECYSVLTIVKEFPCQCSPRPDQVIYLCVALR